MTTPNVWKPEQPSMSTTNKASIVANTLGHKPYSRHCTTPTITHMVLAHDKTVDECLFGEDTSGY